MVAVSSSGVSKIFQTRANREATAPRGCCNWDTEITGKANLTSAPMQLALICLTSVLTRHVHPEPSPGFAPGRHRPASGVEYQKPPSFSSTGLKLPLLWCFVGGRLLWW